jgi:hypothetical protein
MALNYADMDRYSGDGGNAFQGVLNSGSPMGSYLKRVQDFEAASKGLSPEVKQLAFLGMPGFLGAEQIPYEGPGGQKERFKDQLGMLEGAALKRAEMNKKANEESLLIKSIGDIGGNLSRALGGPSWDTIERNRQSGLTAINNINPSTIQPLSTAQFQPRSYYS